MFRLSKLANSTLLISLISFFLLGIFTGFIPTQAQQIPTSSTLCSTSCPLIANPPTTTNATSLVTFILNVARFLTYLAGAVAVLAIVYGGILYITDNGSGDGAKKGKTILINGVIGLVIVIVAYTVVGLVGGLVQGNLLGGFTA